MSLSPFRAVSNDWLVELLMLFIRASGDIWSLITDNPLLRPAFMIPSILPVISIGFMRPLVSISPKGPCRYSSFTLDSA